MVASTVQRAVARTCNLRGTDTTRQEGVGAIRAGNAVVGLPDNQQRWAIDSGEVLMATEYRVTCDACGIVVQGFNDRGPELSKNNWDIGVSNFWLDDSDKPEYKTLRTECEARYSVCHQCAKVVADTIKRAIVSLGPKPS